MPLGSEVFACTDDDNNAGAATERVVTECGSVGVVFWCEFCRTGNEMIDDKSLLLVVVMLVVLVRIRVAAHSAPLLTLSRLTKELNFAL